MKSKAIKLLEALEASKDGIKSQTLTEQLLLTRELNVIESKIEVLKYLLEDV